MVYICGCLPARIPHALAELPETLDETYQRTLRSIHKANWKVIHRLFQFIAVASRPLRVEELSELLAFDFLAGPIPKFHDSWRMEDSLDAVLSSCSSLLTIVDGGYGKVIQFSHLSVIEFLTSSRLAEASDIIIRRYHVSIIPAHTIAAQACLGTLLHLDKNSTRDSLQELPLAEYAAEHWIDHAQVEGVSQIEDGLKKLFDPRNPYLAACVWIHDPWKRNRRAERPLPPHGTALHYAALWGLHFIVEFLVIEHSQDVNSRAFANRATPLHLASQRGQLKAARTLIENGANVMAQNEDGETPLHLASQGGQVEVVRMLIYHGADVTAQSKDGVAALHLASQRGQLKAARMLLEHGADATAQNKDGVTPLHLASQGGQLEVVCMLIEHGVDVTAPNKDGDTLLHLASQRGQLEVARILIEHGADATTQNKDGVTPLHLASQGEQVEVIHMLIENGADVTAQNNDGVTPLHLASQRGQARVARMLIDHGADATAQNKDVVTPLHLASQGGQLEVARILIDQGADATAQNKDRETPLHLASQEGQLEVVRVLLEHGVDATAQNKDGVTPLHLASQGGQLEVIRIRAARRNRTLRGYGPVCTGPVTVPSVPDEAN